jgi:hypothetical protein
MASRCGLSTGRAVLRPSGRPRVATILGLLDRRCPSTITRLVVPVAIDAINGCSVGSRAHVLKECIEGAPAVARSDSTSSVAGIRGISRIVDTPQHGHPRTPRRVVRSFDRCTNGSCRGLRCAPFLDFRARVFGMLLPLHRMTNARIVSADVLGNAIAPLVNSRELPASTCAQLRPQWLRATPALATLGFRDAMPSLRREMITVRCHVG